MMRLYRTVTGVQNLDLKGFWETTPAELFEWAEVIMGADEMDMDDISEGEEVED